MNNIILNTPVKSDEMAYINLYKHIYNRINKDFQMDKNSKFMSVYFVIKWN